MSEEAIVVPAPNQACLTCRASKIKCRPLLGGVVCERCTRKELDCVFHHKKRGRKPGTRVENLARSKRNPPPTKTSRLELSSNLHLSPNSSPVPFFVPPRERTGSSSNRASDRASSATSHQPENVVIPPTPDFWAESDSLQPTGLLNQQAMKGKFSLENILSTDHEMNTDALEPSSELPEEDPVRQGLVTYHVATSLFHGFMNNLNPFICVLDPVLYTFPYVQARSSFLLTVILAAAAKAFNPDLHATLEKHSERLFVDSFSRGTKSLEAIQAILLLTYWKKPDDTRSFSSIGYVIRLCVELGYHKFEVSPVDTVERVSELQARQKRNAERTWFVLFVYDRGMHLQTGNPWMIERSDFIESVNIWYKSPLATANDTVLGALVTLRLTTADIFEMLIPQRPSPPMNQPHRVGSLLRTLKPQMQAWQKHWAQMTEKNPTHLFIVMFFSTHMRLLLYSFPLQASLSSVGGSLVDNEALWMTYTSALEMLQLVSSSSLAPQLNFAHDSVHVMLAYAAVFLIKLLLSVHNAIREEIEASIVETIQEAAHIFAQQATPSTFSSALQAKFLNNILQEYQRACQQRLINRPRVTKSNSHNVENQEFQQEASTAENDGFQPVEEEVADVHDLESSMQEMDGSQDDEVVDATLAQSQMFNDDQAWAAMFLNAGFNIQEGVFLPGS